MNDEAERFRYWWPYVLAAAHHQAGHYDYRTHILRVVLREDAKKENIVDPHSLDAAVEHTASLSYADAVQVLAPIAKDLPPSHSIQAPLQALQEPALREEKHVVLISQTGHLEVDAFVFPTPMLRNRKSTASVSVVAALALAEPGAGKSG